MSIRRPGTLRRTTNRVSTLSYEPLPTEEDDAHDYDDPTTSTSASHRPSHIRETSRTALLPRHSMASIRTISRSVRSMMQVPTLSSPVQMDEIERKTGTDRTAAGANFRNADGEELDAQQRKMALVSQALEDTGMGRYQWCIFFLCGFGYVLDLAWAQAFGLIMPRVQIELGIPDSRYGDIFSVFSAGLTTGAFVWGLLVDIIGRRWAFNLTVGITAAFGVLLGFLESYEVIMGVTFFVGFGLGGNIPIDATITLEFLPQRNRYLLVALSVFQPIGVILTSLICWTVIPKYSCDAEATCSAVAAGSACCTKASNYGWRYSLFAIGGLSVCAFLARFVLFHFRESPRFLITKGKDSQAVEVCAQIALTNGRTPTLTLSMLEDIDTEAGSLSSSAGSSVNLKERYKLGNAGKLFASAKMARLTLLTWAVYMSDHWGFTIAGSFLPKILAERGAGTGVGIDVTYRNYIVIALAGVPGVLLGAALVEVPSLGRKWAMVVSGSMMALSLFGYATVTTFEGSVGLNAMEYFFQSTFNAVLYAWTPEAFPASVRGSASGLASFWGRLASIIAPLAAARASPGNAMGQLYMAGAGVVVCVLLAACLPDTRRVDVL